MGPYKYNQNMRLITLAVITLSGFHCTHVKRGKMVRGYAPAAEDAEDRQVGRMTEC